jgi:hypothetical protein
MPITASIGALSYSRNGASANVEYWYLETNSNITFNGASFDSTDVNFYVVGQNPSTQLGLMLRINENNNYPRLIYDFDMSGNVPGSSIGNVGLFYDITFNSSYSSNLVAWGSFNSGASANYYSAVTMPFSPSIFVEQPPIGGTSILSKRFGASTSADALKTMTICSVAPSTTATEWVLYRTANRLSYRNALKNNYNVSGPLTYVTGSSVSEYIPQTILTDTTGNAVALMNLSDASTNNTLIRRVNKTSVGGSFPFYPTIWQRSYDFGVIEQAVLDTSNNIYFVSTDFVTSSVIVKYDINGNLIWQRSIANVYLQGIAYSSNYLYVCGTISSNNNLFIAKYNLNGNLQWQRQLSGMTFDGKKIKASTNGVYIVGQANLRGFTFKVPLDGSIPGTGSFTLGSTNYTYSIASQFEGPAIQNSTTPSTGDNSAFDFGGNYGMFFANNGVTVSTTNIEA